MSSLTGAEVRERGMWFSATRTRVLSARAAAVIAFALLTWAGAKVRVPLPFTPVPGTLQTLPVLLAGVLLGARAGAASQALYVMMGIAGLPVFALPGAGPAYLLGPTGGYLVGFVAAAFAAGRVHRRAGGWGLPGALLSFLAGSVALYACGLAWLTAFFDGDLAAACRAGLRPFVLFDLAKVVIATGLHSGWRRLQKRPGAAWNNDSPR